MAKKLLNGCDILFVINNDLEKAIRMGSNLSSELISYNSIAEYLSKNESLKKQLKEELKSFNENRLVTKEEIDLNGIIHNSTVESIAKKYPHLDWKDINQSHKLLLVNWFEYYGKDLSDCIIRTTKHGIESKIFVINPSNMKQVDKLYDYLTLEKRITYLNDETKGIIAKSQLKTILSQLQGIVEDLDKLKARFDELSKITERNKKEEKEYNSIVTSLIGYELLKLYLPKTETELLLDFLEHSKKYYALTYQLNEEKYSVLTELLNVVNEILNKKIKIYTYNDVFANEISSNSRWSKAKQMHYIEFNKFLEALLVKKQDLEYKISKFEPKTSLYKEAKKNI